MRRKRFPSKGLNSGIRLGQTPAKQRVWAEHAAGQDPGLSWVKPAAKESGKADQPGPATRGQGGGLPPGNKMQGHGIGPRIVRQGAQTSKGQLDRPEKVGPGILGQSPATHPAAHYVDQDRGVGQLLRPIGIGSSRPRPQFQKHAFD
jgi:hypothetical protein